MKKFWLSFTGSLLLLTVDSFAALQYRSEAEIMSEDSKAFEFQYSSFSKKTSYDQNGTELVSSSGDSFSVTDAIFKYSKGILPEVEGSVLANLRTVKSASVISSASNSGLESIGFEAKYLFGSSKRYNDTFGLHFKKAMFKNNRYDISSPPPVDKVPLGDDGLEYGADYLLTYFDKYCKYSFKFGYNNPSASLSSEIVYNAEAIFSFSKLSLLAGIGGITSLKNDQYTAKPLQKPMIDSGNERLFNSINREKKYLYAGFQFNIYNFSIGLKGESVFSGKYTDAGNTISFNIRWEEDKNLPELLPTESSKGLNQKNYLAEGFVETVSKSGLNIKINIGTENQIVDGMNVDIFNINDYKRGHPMATGTVIETSAKWSIVKITKKFNQLSVKIAYLVKVYNGEGP